MPGLPSQQTHLRLGLRLVGPHKVLGESGQHKLGHIVVQQWHDTRDAPRLTALAPIGPRPVTIHPRATGPTPNQPTQQGGAARALVFVIALDGLLDLGPGFLLDNRLPTTLSDDDAFSGQFSRPLPGPPWSGENGVGLAWVHAVSSLMRSARGFSLAWSRRVRDRGLLP